MTAETCSKTSANDSTYVKWSEPSLKNVIPAINCQPSYCRRELVVVFVIVRCGCVNKCARILECCVDAHVQIRLRHYVSDVKKLRNASTKQSCTSCFCFFFHKLISSTTNDIYSIHIWIPSPMNLIKSWF
jgi:hypothetical protein